ncbi:hypothetical protein N2152v2_005363 [Parachlorella kessleri]
MLPLFFFLALTASPCLAQTAGHEVLTLSQTLALAANSTFNPLLDCGLDNFTPYNASFLGELQTLRTGDVLQAFYRFRRDDCSENSTSFDPSQAPLLLLPAMESTINDWGVSFLAAVSCGREVVALEYRGCGQSLDYSPEPLTYYTMADGVVQLVEALNLTRPHVFGWSTGGDIAFILGALHGGRFGRLAAMAGMAGSNHTVLPDEPDILSPAATAALDPVQQLALTIPPQDPDFADVTCQFVKDIMSMPGGIGVTVNDSVAEAQYIADVDFTTVDPTIWDALPTIKNPVLVIQGAQDALVPAINAQLISSRIPNSWLARFPSWGHRWKDNAALVALLSAFFDSPLS